MFIYRRKALCLECGPLGIDGRRELMGVSLLVRSGDLECTKVFLSALPRSVTVAIIYALRLLSLHL